MLSSFTRLRRNLSSLLLTQTLLSSPTLTFQMSTTPPSLKTQLASGTSRHASEQIQLVSSSSNTCIGGSNRSQMRLNNSCHRATYIFVKRKSDDKLVVQKRSMIKGE